MTISQLIEHLQLIEEKHGDLPVCRMTDRLDWCVLDPDELSIVTDNETRWKYLRLGEIS